VVVKIKEELFFIRHSPGMPFPGIIAADGIALTWSDNYRLQVPQDRKYIFRPGHTFCAEFNTGALADYAATDRVRIELRDADEKQTIQILQDTRYGNIRHFADRDLIRRLDIVEEVEATAGMWIVVMTLPNLALAPGDPDTYFTLTSDIVRQTIL